MLRCSVREHVLGELAIGSCHPELLAAVRTYNIDHLEVEAQLATATKQQPRYYNTTSVGL